MVRQTPAIGVLRYTVTKDKNQLFFICALFTCISDISCVLIMLLSSLGIYQLFGCVSLISKHFSGLQLRIAHLSVFSSNLVEHPLYFQIFRSLISCVWRVNRMDSVERKIQVRMAGWTERSDQLSEWVSERGHCTRAELKGNGWRARKTCVDKGCWSEWRLDELVQAGDRCCRMQKWMRSVMESVQEGWVSAD